MGNNTSRIINCRGKKIELGSRTLIMGILNVTPDSFSDGLKYMTPEIAVEKGQEMIAEGADIIDLGGVSTKPGYKYVSEDEELERIIPVLERLVKIISVPISIDTWRARVAKKALDLGANIINDQWALKEDYGMAGIAASYNVPVILMHNSETGVYGDIIEDMKNYFAERMNYALSMGISKENLIVDPGIGFAKSYEQNIEVLSRLSELKELGLPILLAASRKSVIGKTLDLPVDQRIEGTAATVALGIVAGADIVRIHDVKEMVRVAKMSDAIVRKDVE